MSTVPDQPHSSMSGGSDPAEQPRSIRRFMIAVLVGFAAWVAVEGWVLTVNLERIGLLDDAIDGREDLPAIIANDDAYAASGLYQLAMMIILAVLFIVWQFAARNNAERICPDALHHRHKAWLVFGWIVPIINLWFPKQMIDDIYNTSDPARMDGSSTSSQPGRRPSLIASWWAAWIAWALLSNVVGRFILRAETLEDLRMASQFEAAVLPLGAIAAILAIMVVRRITEDQERAVAARATPGLL